MLLIIPLTVCPSLKRVAFSSQVPSSSRSVTDILPLLSILLTTVYIISPIDSLADGWEIRETDMQSIERSEILPQPISRKAPKLSTFPYTYGIWKAINYNKRKKILFALTAMKTLQIRQSLNTTITGWILSSPLPQRKTCCSLKFSAQDRKRRISAKIRNRCYVLIRLY